MTITDEVASLEGRLREAEARNKALSDQVERQKGALLESRAQNEQLIKRNEKLCAQLARLYKHFRDTLSSGEDVIKHRKELEPELPGVPAETPPVTLKTRLKRLAKNGGDAA